MVITGVMLHQQRKLVSAFEDAGAINAAHARTAAQLGVQPGMAWQHLVGHAVLRCPGEARYFLDVANWQRLRRRRRYLAFVVIAALLFGLALVMLSTRTH